MVTLYSQEGCPQCKMIHMLLDKNRVEYIECQDIEKMKELDIRHTPALEVDGKILLGKDIFSYVNRTK